MGALGEVLSIPKQLPNQGSPPSGRWAPGLCTRRVPCTCPNRSAWGAGQATLGSPVPCSPAPGQRPQRSGCISGTGQVGGDAAAHFVRLARTGQEGTWHCPTPVPVIHPRGHGWQPAAQWAAGPGLVLHEGWGMGSWPWGAGHRSPGRPHLEPEAAVLCVWGCPGQAVSGFLPEVEGEVCPLVASWEQLVKVSSQEALPGLLAGRSTWAGNSSPQDRI